MKKVKTDVSFVVDRAALEFALGRVNGAVSKRATLPVLGCVLLEAKGDVLRVSGSNLDIGIRTVVTLREAPSEEWAFCLPAKRLESIVKDLQGEDLKVSLSETEVVLEAGETVFRLAFLEAGEFPALPELKKATASVSGDRAAMSRRLRSVLFAASADAERYALCGVHWRLKDGEMRLVATDGRRLAWTAWRAPEASGGDWEFILPAGACSVLSDLLGSTGELLVECAGNVARFVLTSGKGPDVTMVSKLIEGNYPNVERVFPAVVKASTIEVDRLGMARGVKRVALVLEKKDSSLLVSLKDGQLHLTAKAYDVGSAGERVQSLDIDFGDLAVAFNPVFLLDALKAIDDERVRWQMIDETAPLLISAGEWRSVVMPLRIN